MISEDGVSPLPSKIEAIKQIPVPKTVKEVRSFLGLSGYYRRFIKNYATISAPLTKLTTKTCTTQFNWTADCENAFTLLKTCLCKSPVLVHPKFDREFLIQTDASDIGLGQAQFYPSLMTMVSNVPLRTPQKSCLVASASIAPRKKKRLRLYSVFAPFEPIYLAGLSK